MELMQTRLTLEEIRIWAKAVVAQAFDKIPIPSNVKCPPPKWWLE